MGSIEIPNCSGSIVYKTISDFIDFPSHEQKLWWHSTAPMFAEMLRVAGYDLHSQYKILGIFLNHVIPFLGVYPTRINNRWLSILTRYGTPFELSLNCSQSLVRYTYEPINSATGTVKDPFNTHSIWDALDRLMPLQKGIDLEFFKHLKQDLTVDDQDSAYLLENNLVGGQIRTQNKLALDLKGGNFVLKTYIYPALKALATGKSIKTLMFDSVYRLCRQNPSLEAPLRALEEYVDSKGPNSTSSPRLLSCDLIDPSKSRVKIYILELNVTLEAMEDLWTMGGRLNDASTLAGLEMLRELWDLIKLPPGMREYPEPFLQLGTIPDEQLPLMANYTLHHDQAMPEPQVYFTTFGLNDGRIADGLVTFFERRGWNHMAQTYNDSLRAYYPHADQETLNYLHAYISFSYRKGKPYLSVYLQTFETGDWPISNFGIPVVKPLRSNLGCQHPISFSIPITKAPLLGV
ncbi:tryptophan dimethylallyltransferase [Trichophyton mentagrophytes]|nr:tryptophan dimethylallyltransferase [Trichophyton mentagrophytes]